MNSILVLLHCESNAGYAIAPLERVFFEMAQALCGRDPSRVHFAYPSMARGPSMSLPESFDRYVVMDASNADRASCLEAQAYVSRHGIDTVFGFDQPVRQPLFSYLRRGGVKRIISYWGAPMSALFGPLKLGLKRVDVALARHGPDHYIFESQGMAETAVRGRGIPRRRTSVVYLGVDTRRFHPDPADAGYVYEQLGIPRGRKLLFYSGHFEERKGVAVIMRAANRLARDTRRDDWHFVLFGNRPGEEQRYLELLSPGARERVTFGGYRGDLERIHRGCYAGIVASTGWDSLTLSSMEMQASGLPVLASDLPGLREAVEHGQSGFHFEPGSDLQLFDHILNLLDQPAVHARLSRQARARVERGFSRQRQVSSLIEVVRRVASPPLPAPSREAERRWSPGSPVRAPLAVRSLEGWRSSAIGSRWPTLLSRTHWPSWLPRPVRLR